MFRGDQESSATLSESRISQGRKLAPLRFSNVPRWATNPNYEKITLHFSQCRAARSLRTEDRCCRSGEFTRACENRKEHDGRKSAGRGEEGDHGRESAGGGEEGDDDHDFEPE